jgi:tetratricopeptide (TPR) repeat protein
VPIDRAAILRNAEKLLRQGKLAEALAEYVRIVQDQPGDWNTANVLGDLYVRSGQTEKAVEQFIRIADHLSDDGFLQKAFALYKKILKLKPDHEHAMVQAAEIAGSQGLVADARTYLKALAERRRARGDHRGMAQIRIRLATLDPNDYDARLAAARARVELKDTEGAVRDFKEVAAELVAKGRQKDAFGALREAAMLSPQDPEIRERLIDVYLAAGDYPHARECASNAEQLKAMAARLESIGQSDEALLTWQDAARRDPEDAELRTKLARAFVERGDMQSAAQYLTVESAGSNPQLLLQVAEIRLRAGKLDEGLALVRQMLEEDPNRRQDVAFLGWTIAEQSADLGYQLVEIAAEADIAQADYPSAAAALQEYVTRVPNHIPALLRLVEICVDGGLEATMYSAQAQLADAYIAAGSAAEARFIAEDLVAREPWDRANIERFRRALVLLGEPDPDALIAERLSGQSPFMSTDLTLAAEDLPAKGAAKDEKTASAPAPEAPIAPPPAAPPVAAREPAARPPSAQPPPKTPEPKTVGVPGLDLESILGELEKPPTTPTAKGRKESVEVDLSIVLEDIKKPPPEAPFVPRDESSRRAAMEAAEEEHKRGLALFNAGRIDEAVVALQAASRAPRLRFATASMLGRIYRDRGVLPQAVEWFERAAEAPAPSPEQGHQLLYELADVLESTGETARALAICMELQADVGEYRDVAARIDRLAKVQMRG